MAGGLFDNGSGPSVIDCKAFIDSDLPDCLGTLLQMGVLVSIGTTRDRGAVSITVTLDGEYDREYFRTSSEACDYLRRAAASLQGRGLGIPTSDLPSPQKPTRRRSRLS